MKKNLFFTLFILFGSMSLFAQHGLVVDHGNQNNGTTGGQVVIGTEGSYHVQYDNNGIQASSGVGASTLYQNYWGGNIDMLGFLNSTGNLSVDGGGLYYQNSTNRVGIGTTAPASSLHVVGNEARLSTSGNTARYISLRTDGAGLDVNAAGGFLYLSSSSGEVRINNNNLLRAYKGVRVSGNNDGTAWSLGVNGQTILRGYTNVRRTDVSGEAAFLGEMNHTGNSDDPGVLGRNEIAANYGVGVQGEGYYRGVRGYSIFNGTGTRAGVWGSASGGAAANYSVYGAGASGASDPNNNYGGYFVGRLAYTGSLVNASDARLKTNLKEVEPVLEQINRLDVKHYEFKKEMIEKMGVSTGKQTGFMAQDLQKVFPELVSSNKHPIEGEKDQYIDYLGVNYVGLIPILTKGMQELSAENAVIKSENAELKQRLEALEAAVFNK